MAQRVKRLPAMQETAMQETAMQETAMQETWVRSLDGEDPLEKEMATHSSILESNTTERLTRARTHTHTQPHFL